MGVHNYSINDSLKIILDNCFKKVEGKFFGILCAAGGDKSYLSTMHLTQICMNEWKMIQLPRIVYASSKDFNNNALKSKEVKDWMTLFCDEFTSIGKKLMS
jgi:FMN reductase